MVVARNRNRATPFGGAGHVGVLENVRRAVNTWALAVPDTKHPIKLVGAGRRKPQLLRAPHRSSGKFFIDTRLKNNVALFQVLGRLDQRLVIPAQRRATVT